MPPRSIVIIQARATSTRLPNKVALDLSGQSVLEHVVRRALAIPGADGVCVAVPEGIEHDHVAELGRSSGAGVVRGPEHDVLERYLCAAEEWEAGVVVRVTSDCPLLDPMVAGQVLGLVRLGGADYATNNMPATWPHGLDCEAFTRELLEDAARSARTPYDREHVSPWMRRNRFVRRANLLGPGGAVAELRLTVDVPEDLAMMRRLFARLRHPQATALLPEVLSVLERFPDIASLNAAHHGEGRPAM